MVQQSFANQLNPKLPWTWLVAIAAISGIYGWMLAQYNSLFALLGTLAIAIAVAGVRACYQAGFPVWAGLWSLTFGTVSITVGALTSLGYVGWAVAIFALGAGIFLLETAIRKVADKLRSLFGLEASQISMIWSTVAVGGIISGWIARLVLI